MGLAYNLDATENPYIKQGLSKYFVTFPQELQEAKVNFSLAVDKAFDAREAKTSFKNGLLVLEIQKAEESQSIQLM